MTFLSTWHLAEDRLRYQPRICIIGLGFGSHIADAVGRELAHRIGSSRHDLTQPIITLIDGDEFKARKGDHESFHREGSKVEVKAELLRLILPEATIIPINKELWRNNTRKLLADQDIIIAFTDVNNMKFYLSRWITRNKRDVVLITGGIYQDESGSFVRVHIREKGKNLTPGVEHGLITLEINPTIARSRDGFLGGRDRSDEHHPYRNLLMTATAAEVLQIFCHILDGELSYDTVELEHSGGTITRETYFRGDVYGRGRR
jgi:hypothetical protein